MSKIYISYYGLEKACAELADKIKASEKGESYNSVYGVPRGGVPVAIILSQLLKLPLADTPFEGTLIVDDLEDSGATLKRFEGYDTAVVYHKPVSPGIATYGGREIDGWVVFPYEEEEKDSDTVIERMEEMLRDDPDFRLRVKELLA